MANYFIQHYSFICMLLCDFGRPLVKRFALSYRDVVCLSVLSCLSCPVCPVLSVLSVTLVYFDQTVGHIKIKLGMQVGLGLSLIHI